MCKNLSMFSTGFRVACVAVLMLLDTTNGYASSISDTLPPPGLYRIDTDGTVRSMHGGQVVTSQRMQTAGAGGATNTRVTVPGQPAITRKYPGQTDQTVCVKPAAPTLPPPLAGCVSAPARLTDTGVVMDNKCGYLNAVTTIRKLDDKTWEYTTRTLQYARNRAQAMADSTAGLRAMAENVAKYGKTVEEREKARQFLDNLPGFAAATAKSQEKSKTLQSQLDRAQAEGAAKSGLAASADAPISEATIVQHWTRIADACTGGAK